MTEQQAATATPTGSQLAVASFAVAIVAIVFGAYGLPLIGLTLAAAGFGLSVGGAIQNPHAWGYWVAGAIISLGVALRLLA